MTKLDQLLEKAQGLPQKPGCYLMKDRNGRVIYVGKAKKLKSRVISYFNQSAKSIKTQFMVSHVDEFDFIMTSNEAESFILENNLIKTHVPKYNIRLRDDKSYPYLQINWDESFPRLEFVRRPKKTKGKQLFGPFPTGINISSVMRVLTKSFGLRDCTLTEFKSRKNPCLLFQMKHCSAPCVNLIASQEYHDELLTALGLFQGPLKAKRVVSVLEEKMMKYAELEEFEMAVQVRDHIKVLQDFLSHAFDQKVESLTADENIDVWSYWVGEEEVDISIYLIRAGLLLGQKNFHFVKGELIDDIDQEVLSKVMDYYSDISDEVVPGIVALDFEVDEILSLAEALSSFGIKKVQGRVLKFRPLIEMCRGHAEEAQKMRMLNRDSVYIGLNKLKDLLNLKERPKILECYDVAIWQGISPTASQIVYDEGRPDKAKYRSYHLETRPEGNNDFAMMKEVVGRRIKHGHLPDVFVIDGGVAQVNVVLAVLNEFNLAIPVVGIAKSKNLSSGNLYETEVIKSEERLIIPGRSNPYFLAKCPSLFKIIVSMRDEAHRFSRKLHHKKESQRVIASWTEEIKGLNEKAKSKIFNQIEVTKEELESYSVNELMNYLALTSREAKILWAHLKETSKKLV